jgi:hypothetical protein
MGVLLFLGTLSFLFTTPGVAAGSGFPLLSVLTGMEQGILALYGCAASIAWLCLGLAGVPRDDFTLPWAVIPVPAFAAAFWLASRYRARLQGRAGWRARISVFLHAVLLIRALFTRPVRHRGAVGAWHCSGPAT